MCGNVVGWVWWSWNFTGNMHQWHAVISLNCLDGATTMVSSFTELSRTSWSRVEIQLALVLNSTGLAPEYWLKTSCNLTSELFFISVLIFVLLLISYFFPSLLCQFWLSNRKGSHPVKSWMLYCWWWQFDWSFACHKTPVVTTTSIILSYNKIENGHILVPSYPGYPGKWLVNECPHSYYL